MSEPGVTGRHIPGHIPGRNAGPNTGIGEILARLARAPAAAGQLMAATALITLLGLAVSLYTIQVLNRFVANAATGTLLTLTVGAMLAVAAEHQLRKLRWSIAEGIAGDQDRRLATGLYGLLLTMRLHGAATPPPAAQAELVRGVERAAGALGPAGITALADLPFALLILAVLALLSPVLGGVTALFCAALALRAWLDQRRLAGPSDGLNRSAAEEAALVGAALASGETIRHFRGQGRMMGLWQGAGRRTRALGRLVGWVQLRGGSLTQVTQGLLSVAVVAAGALQVVGGTLDVATLIGANMIAGRALAPFGRIVQLGASLRRAGAALAEARRFAAVAVEPDGGRDLPDWRGRLSLRGVACAFPGGEAPVFGPLDCEVEAGGVVVITGRNGSGKSTLLKAIAGLLAPVQGRILADGIDTRQLSLDGWRARVSYLPQEPDFLPGTLRENLLLARPDATEADLRRCLAEADLAGFVDAHPRGLDLALEDGGRRLSPGIRRRLGLARALLTDGVLYLLDEPSEGLDREGARVVYERLIALARDGRTLLIASHDPVILAGAKAVIRLDRPGTPPPVMPAQPAIANPVVETAR